MGERQMRVFRAAPDDKKYRWYACDERDAWCWEGRLEPVFRGSQADCEKWVAYLNREEG